jgi:nucleoside-diphosphate-sugar epimerase
VQSGHDLLPQLEPNGPVLVTGATGQVGLCVIRRLLAAGMKVVCLYRSNIVDFTHPNLSWLQSDLKNGELNLEEYAPKTIVHTASIWLLPKHLETLSKAGVKRVIAFSSTSVFGKAHSLNPYEQVLVDRFKKAEQAIAALCAKYGMEYTIIRPTLIYGVGLDQNISSIVRFIKRFECFPIYGIGKGKRKPVHTDDLALAVLSAIGNPATYGKSYNLCGGETVAYYDMVERIFYMMDKSPMLVKTKYLPMLLDLYSKLSGKKDTNGEVAKRMNIDLVFDDSDARQDFGYNPRIFLAGEREDIEPTFKGE